MMGRRRLFVVLWLVLVPYLAHAKQLALVADTGNATTNIASPELVKMFNAHTRNWPDGAPITIVLKDPSSAEMQLVVRKLFNMTTDQARAFVHTHPGQIVIADSEEAVLRFVSSTRGAIGIIDLYSLTKDVHVLKIDGKLPVEQGYLLRGN
jgi:ABC-type phosphate transport system substrate-binding protein